MIKCNDGHYYDRMQNTKCPFCAHAGNFNFSHPKKNETIRPVSALKTESNAFVQMDIAPDGLPRCMNIGIRKNRLNISDELFSFAGKDFGISSDQVEMINALESGAVDHLLSKRVIELPSINESVIFSKLPLANIAPPTLLAQLLGKASPLDNINRASKGSQLQDHTGAMHPSGDARNEENRREINAEKYFAISENGSGYVVSMDKNLKIFRKDSFYPYIPESLNLLQPSFEITNQDEIIDSGMVENLDLYSNAMLKMARSRDGRKISMRISRCTVANQLILLADNLQSAHAAGFIHCDVKPLNVLTLANTVGAIDPLRVPINEISIGFTPNYCAPEQVLARPVCPSTDIYNLGLMILKLLNGVLFGAIKEYVVPTGGDSLTHVKLLESPDVYLDSLYSHVPKDGIPFWRDFLRRCLAFDVKARYPDIAGFLHEFSRLLEHFPLVGSIEFSPNFGSLAVFESRSGDEYVGWKLFDE